VPIEIVNRQRLFLPEQAPITQLAGAVLAELGFEHAALTIAFVRDPAIRRLNRDHRGVDTKTDVLSFPAHSRPARAPGSYLGDVVISIDSAIKQAAGANISLDREVAELVIHGILHLCGYDHEVDAGQMDRLELKLRKRLLDALK
jgi:probable rRNA maturation factor